MQRIALLPVTLDELKKELISGIREELEISSKPNFSQEDFIKSDKACEILGISKVTLTEWRKRGLINYHKIGSRVFFKRSEILDAGNTKK